MLAWFQGARELDRAVPDPHQAIDPTVDCLKQASDNPVAPFAHSHAIRAIRTLLRTDLNGSKVCPAVLEFDAFAQAA